MHGLRVGPSKIHGRGVFAERRFTAGEEIERCEVLRVPRREREGVLASVLFMYAFTFEGGDLAIALGHGSFYNHSDTSNAEYVKDSQNNQVVFTAIRDIEPGEEITIGYDSWAKREQLEATHRGLLDEMEDSSKA